MTPAGPRGRGAITTDVDKMAGLHSMSVRQINSAGIVLVCVILLLSLGMAVAQMRLRTVRGRLLRLQSEIAKARRKVADGPSSPLT